MMARRNTGSLDGGDAHRWIEQLIEHGTAAIRDAFDAVERAGTDHLDGATGAAAMAAAEVVARWRHGTVTGHDLVDGWLASVEGRPSTELVEAARRAVQRVAEKRSSLAGRRDGDPEWQRIVDTLTGWLSTADLGLQGTVIAGSVGFSPNTRPTRPAGSRDEAGLTRRDTALLTALHTAGIDLSRRHAVTHHLFFRTEADAAAASEEAKTHGWSVEIQTPDDRLAAWSLLATRPDVLIEPEHVRESSAFFDALARDHGGLNDGWELPESESSE